MHLVAVELDFQWLCSSTAPTWLLEVLTIISGIPYSWANILLSVWCEPTEEYKQWSNCKYLRYSNIFQKPTEQYYTVSRNISWSDSMSAKSETQIRSVSEWVNTYIVPTEGHRLEREINKNICVCQTSNHVLNNSWDAECLKIRI